MCFWEENGHTLVLNLGWVRSCASSHITVLQSHISTYLLDILLPKGGTSWFFLIFLKIWNMSANYLPQPFIYTKDKSGPQIPPEEHHSVLGISCIFCLMSSSKGKVMFNCHGNTLNSSPIYPYTNYKDTVHFSSSFLFLPLVFILLLFSINHEFSTFSIALSINCDQGAKQIL